MLTAQVPTISKIVLCSALLCNSPVLCQSIPEKPQNPAASEPADIPHLAFDVASIHEWRGTGMRDVNNVPRNSLFQAHGISPWGLILAAYNLKIVNLLKGVPDWAMTTQYEVEAKSDSSTDDALFKLSDNDSYAAKRLMLQGLLADRFKLQIHAETQMATTYELSATAKTSKLMTPVQGDVSTTISSCNPQLSRASRDLQSKGCPFSFLLSMLRQELGTTVVDNTGLSGLYAYHLVWSPSTISVEQDPELHPHLADAVHEQLGLDLKQTKGPVTFWVIDHIERPTPN